MSKTERRKGANGELELARVLRRHGWPYAKRTSDGRSQLERGDIGDGPPGIHWEVRRRERFSLWQSLVDAASDARHGRTPVVAFRRSRSPWYVALPLDDFLELLDPSPDETEEPAP